MLRLFSCLYANKKYWHDNLDIMKSCVSFHCQHLRKKIFSGPLMHSMATSVMSCAQGNLVSLAKPIILFLLYFSLFA